MAAKSSHAPSDSGKPPGEFAAGQDLHEEGDAHEHGESEAGHEEAHGGHGGGHGGHGDGHGGGGHGGSWIVTYCDMITLLIAFFICILTFASKENGKGNQRRLRDSVLYGLEGTGIAGPVTKPGVADEFMWRQVLLSANPGDTGSALPPLYSDPKMDITTRALDMLEDQSTESFEDGYKVALPLSLIFDAANKLTPSGQNLLRSLGDNVRHLPFVVLIQVHGKAELKQAVVLAERLIRFEGIDPSQVGLGIAEPGRVREKTVRLVFLRRH
jgi:hypothetical protein